MPGPTRALRRALTVLPTGIALTLLVGGFVPAAAELPAPPPQPEPKAFIAIDADSGRVLTASNEHEPLLTASTVKLMTAVTALQHLPTDAALDVSARAEGRPAINMNMKQGQQWPLLDVLHSALIVSANDAAYVLAENSAGTVEKFADQMAETGKRLGLEDSTFADPDGIDDEQFSFGGGSKMSAYDLAIVGRNALRIPAIAETAATVSTSFDDPTGITRSLHTKNDVFLGHYDGGNGMKTGYTDGAGSNLVASATRDGRTMVAVVLGVPDTAAWAGKLLDDAFAAPPNSGTDTLPAPAAVTAEGVRAAINGMPSVLGRPAMAYTAHPALAAPDNPGPTTAATDAAATQTDPTVAPSSVPPTTAELAPTIAGSGSAEAGTASPRQIDWRIVVLVALVAMMLIVVILRRRAVARRRRKRIERQKLLYEARRRGMIDVVDPIEAGRGHVQVLRDRVSSR